MKALLIWPTLHELCKEAVVEFGVPKDIVLEPFSRRRGVRCDGDALLRPPRIRLRVHKYRRPNQPLASSTVFATLAHELAHLAPGGWDHGKAHALLAFSIASWMRGKGLTVSPMVIGGTFPKRFRKKPKKGE